LSRVKVSLMALALMSACNGKSSAGPPAQSARAEHARSAEELAFRDSEWGAIESRRFSVALSLPERSRWSVDDRTERWLVAVHHSTQSKLRVRTWLAPRLVRPAECAAEARLWSGDIPELSDSAVERRELGAPSGFRTELTVGVRPAKAGQLEGYAVAFGATVGRCYGAIFTTMAGGEAKADVIGRRLAIVVDGVLARVETVAIDQRAEPLERP
jgi:hypothetical protein